MIKIEMVQNDLKPPLLSALKYTDGSIVVLTDCAVSFHMEKRDGTLLIDKAAVIVSKTDGIVRYDWVAGDTNLIGKCYGEFEVTFSDGKTQTFPSDGNFVIAFRKEYA